MQPTSAMRLRVVAVAAVLQLVAGVVAVVVLSQPAVQDPVAAARARALPAGEGPQGQGSAGDERRAARERADEVQALLAARSAAVLARDRQAFLATVDPQAGSLRERQEALFDALGQVPLSTWEYVLDPLSGRPAQESLDARYGPGQWWAPRVVLRQALEGFDEAAVSDDHYLTFVRRDGRWLLGADDDFAAEGAVTQRALWDAGPVLAVRAAGVLVLGHRDPELLQQVAATTAAAVPRVSGVWGDQWPQEVVVLVPSSAAELASLLGSSQDLSRIAALATAEPAADGGTVDRVLVNPETFAQLGEVGRRVVLTHEVTHVATRRATGPAVPTWLSEGLADYVAYDAADVPLPVAAADLRDAVRAGRVPPALPTDDAFDGGNPDLAEAYQQSWLAVRMVAERYGEAPLLDAYRALGATPRGVDEGEALSRALRDAVGLDTARLTAEWQADLQRQLG